MIAGGVSAALGSIPSVIVIYTMVFLSVSLAYYQENNASKAAELLREKVATLATVLRDNTKQEIKLPLIVPGDIILSFSRRHNTCRCTNYRCERPFR